MKSYRRCSCEEEVKSPPEPKEASTSLGFFSFFRSRMEDMLTATLREKEAAYAEERREGGREGALVFW